MQVYKYIFISVTFFKYYFIDYMYQNTAMFQHPLKINKELIKAVGSPNMSDTSWCYIVNHLETCSEAIVFFPLKLNELLKCAKQYMKVDFQKEHECRVPFRWPSAVDEISGTWRKKAAEMSLMRMVSYILHWVIINRLVTPLEGVWWWKNDAYREFQKANFQVKCYFHAWQKGLIMTGLWWGRRVCWIQTPCLWKSICNQYVSTNYENNIITLQSDYP